MYTILNSQGLGVSGRQNELIELALTHRFNAVEVDMADLVGRHDTMGKEFACQFFQSAKIDVGTFEMPIDFSADDEAYQTQVAKIDTILDLAQELGAKRCYISINPNHATESFDDNFAKHVTRLKDIGQRCGQHSVKVGLALRASKAKADGIKFVQTAEELLKLIKSIDDPNVGLCLDAFQWQLGSGAMDQISELDLALFTEVRLGDVANDADPAAPKASDLVLPGDAEGDFSETLAKYLIGKNFEGPLSIATSLATFKGANRERIVGKFRRVLEKLINGEELNPEPEVTPDADGETPADATDEAKDATKADPATEKEPVAAAADAS